jgi:hypothetical protein
MLRYQGKYEQGGGDEPTGSDEEKEGGRNGEPSSHIEKCLLFG